MKRKVLMILCMVVLILSGCSNTTAPLVTDDSSNVISTSGDDYAKTSASSTELQPNDSITESSESATESLPNDSTFEASELVTESQPSDSTAEAAVSLPHDSTLEAAESTLEASPETEQSNIPKRENAYYDNEFRGAAQYTGVPMTYEEVMDMLIVGENEHGEYIDSFFLVETVKALSPDECAELAGWNEDYSDRTIYQVNVIKDLISGEDVNRTEYIFVSMGTIRWQDSGDPIYAPGEKFTVVLAKPQKGCDFLKTPGSFIFRYDVVETDNGDIKLYSRNSCIDEKNFDSAVKIDAQVITSTTLNPAHYTQRIGLTELVDFIRADWQERELSSFFSE